MPFAAIPAPQARPPAWSLVDAANAALDLVPEDQRWEAGFEFAPETCSGGDITDPCNVAPFDFDVDGRPALVQAVPYLVRAGDKCSSFGWTANDYAGRAERLLARCSKRQIAREFWTGEQARANGWPNPYLAQVGADTLTDAPTGVVDVLGCLEQALADCGCGELGMVHATRQVLTHWSTFNLLYLEGGVIRTINGTIVVSDAGYTGEGPNGELPAAGNGQWAYATGLVRVFKGPAEVIPPQFEDAVDERLNDVAFIAQQTAVAFWDGCCHFAAQVDLDPCLTGGTS